MKRATVKKPERLTGQRMHETIVIGFIAVIILFLMVKIVFF
jgi:hypothetical protein